MFNVVVPSAFGVSVSEALPNCKSGKLKVGDQVLWLKNFVRMTW